MVKASVTVSCICRRRTASGFCIDDPGIPDDFLPEMPAQINWCPQVDFPATQHLPQLIFHVRQTKEPNSFLRPELNQYVDVAGVGEAICENRAEESELPDAVPPADLRDLRLGDLYVGDRHAFFSMAHASRRCPG